MLRLIKRGIRGGLRQFGYDIIRYEGERLHGVAGRMSPFARPRDGISILVISIPKSGTVYINKLLAAGLERSSVSLGHGYFPHDLANVHRVEAFARGGCVAAAHFDPCEQNLQILGSILDRWVVHIRDPRSVVLSAAHHLERCMRIDPRLMLYWNPRPPESFLEMSDDERLSWTIENHLPNIVAWTRDWLEVVNRGTYRIMTTTYDDFHENETRFMERILEFHGIPLSMYRAPRLQKTVEKTHYRMGLPAEWKMRFAPALLMLANEMIGSDLLERFNWPLF